MTAVPQTVRSRTRLSTLALSGRTAQTHCAAWDWKDDLSHLTAEKRASWCRVLSSVATVENLEEVLIGPLQEALRDDLEAAEYLEAHAQDEHRHFDLLTRYLDNTFSYRKDKRTPMDRMLYDGVLPQLAKTFRYKPIYALALLHCYERFSLAFYESLRREAQNDGAQNLLTILRAIEKDELRHVAGMETLLREELTKGGPVGFTDLAAIRGILKLMLMDVDMGPWAVHNREVREHLAVLGFDTDGITRAAQESVRETLSLVRG